MPEVIKLETVQTQEKLNDVYSIDDEGPGGAHHHYQIMVNGKHDLMGEIKFQRGPRKEEGSQHGVIDSDLLEIVRDRLKAFQAGPYKNDYTAKALEGVEIALNALNARVEDRINRNVLGKYEK